VLTLSWRNKRNFIRQVAPPAFQKYRRK